MLQLASIVRTTTRHLLSRPPTFPTTIMSGHSTRHRKLSDGFPIAVHFQLPDGTVQQAWATPGEILLDVAIDNGIDEQMQGMFGMCGGAVCCSTCHVMLDDEVYDGTTCQPRFTQ